MTKEEKEAVLHCLRAMIDEELCEECPLYGTTGTDHCEKDCVRLAIEELEQDEYIKVPKKALKYRTAGIVAYNAEWLKNHFDIERAVICGEQYPCDDAISRQAVLDTLENMDKALDEDRTVENYKELLRECCKVLPSVKPKSECEHDHEILKAYSNGASAVLDKVRAEIMNLQTYKMFEGEDAVYVECENVLQIIDEFTAEGSGE